MSRGLSNKLLVHNATLSAAGAIDAYGNITYGEAQNLTKIRVSRAKQTALTALGDAKNDALLLIYDCTKSLPSGVTFSAGDKIVYDGDTYFVRSSDSPNGDENKAVYYRVRLVTDGN